MEWDADGGNGAAVRVLGSYYFRRMEQLLTQLRAYSDQLVKLPEHEWTRFAGIMHPASFNKGQHLLEIGHVCDHVCFLGTGLVRAYRIHDGEDLTEQFFFEGNYATEYESFLTRTPSTVGLQAMEPCTLVRFNYADLQGTYASSPMAERMGRLIAEHIFTGSSRRTRSLLFDTPEQRYLALIKERPKVMARVPQKYIASYLGLKPESLSRIRSRLTRKPLAA